MNILLDIPEQVYFLGNILYVLAPSESGPSVALFRVGGADGAGAFVLMAIGNIFYQICGQ